MLRNALAHIATEVNTNALLRAAPDSNSAALVVFTTRLGRRFLDAMLGFSGGVMLAASYWSLLAPSIEIAANRASAAKRLGLRIGRRVAWAD